MILVFLKNRPLITKDLLLAKLNDPLLPTHTDVAKDLNCDINTLYTHKNFFCICKKNGTYISLQKKLPDV